MLQKMRNIYFYFLFCNFLNILYSVSYILHLIFKILCLILHIKYFIFYIFYNMLHILYFTFQILNKVSQIFQFLLTKTAYKYLGKNNLKNLLQLLYLNYYEDYFTFFLFFHFFPISCKVRPRQTSLPQHFYYYVACLTRTVETFSHSLPLYHHFPLFILSLPLLFLIEYQYHR